jgi:enediyne core biosynthesis thioesterase
MSKEFIFEKTVYLSDTNAFGNAYFAKYVEWQGMTREAFFRVIMPNQNFLIDSGIKLITARAAVEYKHEVYLYDDIEIGLKVGAVKPASSDLIFTYRRKKDGLVFARGFQTVTFADDKGKLMKIPQEIVNNARPYTDEVRYVLGKIFGS